jgi:hypothetical protein
MPVLIPDDPEEGQTPADPPEIVSITKAASLIPCRLEEK